MKLLKTNLCAASATTITASSSNVNFPASNLKNQMRSKRWRSSGTFVIDSTNNKIDFKESGGGSELTATITSGSYSTLALATEIKTQLEATGSNNYTVTFSTTTGLWTIASDGSYFSMLNSSGTNSAESILVESLGFPSTDKTGLLSYSGSLIACHTKESIVFDLKTAQDISSVVLLWPKEDGIKISSGAVIKIEANATDVWTSPAVSQTVTIDDNYLVASHFFSSVQSYRYWRLTIEDPQNPYLYVELGIIWIGETVAFNEPENGFKFSLRELSVESSNDFGHDYTDEYPQITELEFNYAFIEYSVMQHLESAFRENGNRKSVIVVFDETETVFDKDHYLIYGKMNPTFSSEHVSYNLFKGGMKITERV